MLRPASPAWLTGIEGEPPQEKVRSPVIHDSRACLVFRRKQRGRESNPCEFDSRPLCSLGKEFGNQSKMWFARAIIGLTTKPATIVPHSSSSTTSSASSLAPCSPAAAACWGALVCGPAFARRAWRSGSRVAEGGRGNPKFEARNTKQIPNPKRKTQNRRPVGFRSLEFGVLKLFRISCFGFRRFGRCPCE
jgi:hypothetical protein